MTDVDRRGAQAYVRFRLGRDDLPFGAVEDGGSLVEQALKLAATIIGANGATNSGSVDFIPDQTVSKDRSGASNVVLRQTHQGIPVFGGQQLVGFRADGTVDVSDARISPVVKQPATDIKVTAEAALSIAWKAVTGPDTAAVDAASPITLLADFPDLPERPVLFGMPSPWEPARVHLLLFPLEQGLELAWQLDLASDSESHRVIVSTQDGSVLYSSPSTHGLSQSGQVFTLSPAAPRAEVEIPRPWVAYPVQPPTPLADPPPLWAAADSTKGYSVEAFDADTKQPFVGTTVGGAVNFAPANPDSQDQRIVNAFFACAMMHDFVRVLGFGPEDGSYDSLAIFGGLAGKPIRVAVSIEPVLSVANWWRGTIRLGPHGSGRHSALDVTVVTHEYTHGVSNRLIGGGLDDAPLLEPQSRGMAEGWSDYFASMATGQAVIGAWLADDAVKGLRRFAYDANFPVEAANLGILASLATYQIGEMWCAFLCELTRMVGADVAPLLVLDGMKGLLSNPSLIDGRDSILLKIERWQAAGIVSPEKAKSFQAAVWKAAARFGMGKGARTSGTSLDGAAADFSVADG